jgi:hypothetical protein
MCVYPPVVFYYLHEKASTGTPRQEIPPTNWKWEGREVFLPLSSSLTLHNSFDFLNPQALGNTKKDGSHLVLCVPLFLGKSKKPGIPRTNGPLLKNEHSRLGGGGSVT